MVDTKSTELARKCYNRIAKVYDFVEGTVEMSRYCRWREILASIMNLANPLVVSRIAECGE